jgi:hypothetical protein
MVGLERTGVWSGVFQKAYALKPIPGHRWPCTGGAVTGGYPTRPLPFLLLGAKPQAKRIEWRAARRS